MHPEIEQRVQALEERRRALIERVRALPPDRQNKAPNARSFSPVQVIMHMALSERWQNTFLQKTPLAALTGKKPRPTFIFKRIVANMAKPTRRLPTSSFSIPKPAITLEEAERTWQAERENILRCFAQVQRPEEAMVKFPFLVGILSANDYLEVLEAHQTYHEVRFPDG